MKSPALRAVRDMLLSRGGPDESGFIRFAYRPFDNRWLYWEKDGLLDRPRTDYRPHVFEGNMWLEAREREPKDEFARGTLVGDLADNFGNGLSSWFPSWLRDDGLASDGREGRRANLTDQADRYLARLGLGIEDLFHHTLATLHDPAYREANAGALRMGWPRIPLPAGRMARPRERPKRSPGRQRTDAGWPRCSIRNRLCQARSGRTGTPESPCRARSRDITWRARTSR